jgi:hypothetical protein
VRIAVVRLWAGGTVEMPEREVTYRLRGDVLRYRSVPSRKRRRSTSSTRAAGPPLAREVAAAAEVLPGHLTV